MKAILVLSVLLPLTARADLIVLDYQGTVTSSFRDDFVEGAPITGRVTIDTDFAGPDIDPRENLGMYGFDFFGEPNVVPDFISNSLICGRHCPSADTVFVIKDDARLNFPNWDMYQIIDGINGGATRLIIDIRAQDIVVDEGISQSFELHGNEDMSGILEEKGRRVLDFAINLVSVRPGHCSIG